MSDSLFPRAATARADLQEATVLVENTARTIGIFVRHAVQDKNLPSLLEELSARVERVRACAAHLLELHGITPD